MLHGKAMHGVGERTPGRTGEQIDQRETLDGVTDWAAENEPVDRVEYPGEE